MDSIKEFIKFFFGSLIAEFVDKLTKQTSTKDLHERQLD